VNSDQTFQFGAFASSVHISREFPSLQLIADHFRPEGAFFRPLIICDENTRIPAEKIAGSGGPGGEIPLCVLKPGESAKNWASVEAILGAAAGSGLGRDGLFIGIGGGVIGDVSAFAASIYMRGCRLCLVSTTLLGMADASLGGKTGFDLFGVKNMAGTFYPARHVYMPLESLKTLPPAEWKSGMAELIKTAILEGGSFMELLESLREGYPPACFHSGFPREFIPHVLENRADTLAHCVSRAVALKGRIVQTDPLESGGERRLLNLGHTFGHALESSAGLGKISHGEAVAWGTARACELGVSLGVTPRERGEKITALLRSFGYETRAPHPLMGTAEAFFKALNSDKKKISGNIMYIVPDEQGARPVTVEKESLVEQITGSGITQAKNERSLSL
jgi:3-dehydroquinate synthase